MAATSIAAQELRAMADRARKPMVAHAGTFATSAAAAQLSLPTA